MTVLLHISEIAGAWFVVSIPATLFACALFAGGKNVLDDRPAGVWPSSDTARPEFVAYPSQVASSGPASNPNN